ncbi:unnamed protein product [Durusdinium trenchii]|uniref:Uncharacterized protein n=1 Tax=Durusdinium trenchii TaxID=1381693 RepID=A0ABP0JK71_9DINO
MQRLAPEFDSLFLELRIRSGDTDSSLPLVRRSGTVWGSAVARAIGLLIGRALLSYPMTRIVVTDANRQGRNDFLDELDSVLGLSLAGAKPPYFQAMPVPTWAAADETDPFDGSMPQEVGLLRLS